MTNLVKWMVLTVITVLMVSACNRDANLTPSATLRGAIVPTRISTETPTNTPTITVTSTPTNTITATSTSTPTPTSTNTATPTITNTPAPTFTATVDSTALAGLIDDGDAFLELGSYQRAIERYNDAIELDPNSLDAFMGRGLSYYYLSDYEPAIADYSQVIELDPQEINAYYNRGLANLEFGNLDSALNDFSTVVGFDPQDSEAYYQLGMVYFELEDEVNGFASFDTAIDINPAYAQAYGARGMAYYLNEDYSLALPDFENYVLYSGNDATQEMRNLLEETRNILVTLTPQAPDTTPMPPATIDPNIPLEPIPIQYGDEVEGEIVGDVYRYVYLFEASAGDRVDIKMKGEGGDLDPYIILQNADGEKIAENDDDPNGPPKDSFLQGILIQQDGTYQIIATRFQQELGSTVGNFLLLLELTPDQGGNNSQPSEDGNLNFGDSVEGTITNEVFEIPYTFRAKTGDVVNIQITTPNEDDSLDTLLILQNEDGEKIVENDDDPEGTGGDSFLRNFEIPADGDYTILVTRFQGDLGSTEGDFILTLTIGSSSPEANVSPIELGDVAEDEITRTRFEYRYSFDADAGTMVNIRMQADSGTLDSYLYLLDDEGNEITKNDDAENGIGKDAFIREFIIPADGTYTIVATRFQRENGTTMGRFTVTLDEVRAET